jgi:hypothetical protein
MEELALEQPGGQIPEPLPGTVEAVQSPPQGAHAGSRDEVGLHGKGFQVLQDPDVGHAPYSSTGVIHGLRGGPVPVWDP